MRHPDEVPRHVPRRSEPLAARADPRVEGGRLVLEDVEIRASETAFPDLPGEDNALSTVTIQLESFYAQARDADVLIYNSTTAGDVESMETFLALSPILKDFKAVKENNVWCTEMSMFQRSSAAADMIADIRAVLDGAEEDLTYLHRIS